MSWIEGKTRELRSYTRTDKGKKNPLEDHHEKKNELNGPLDPTH